MLSLNRASSSALWIAIGLALALCSPIWAAETTANAGPDIVVTLGQTITLDGSASSAADGKNLTYKWRLVREPDEVETITDFACPTDWAEEYGTRVRGFILPPATGEYTFWIASDDNSELWLSSDANEKNRRKIASVSDYTDPNEWTKFPSQKSVTIQLTQGKLYYIESLQKEGGGGDNLSVAWAYPGQACTVIPGSHMAAYTADGPGKKGGITREVWLGIAGSAVADLTDSPRFGGREVAIDHADKAVASITPKLSGSYLLELTVSDGATTAADQVNVLVTDVLRNGGFEGGLGDKPDFWLPGSPQMDRSSFTWERNGGIDNSRCVSITTEGKRGNDAWWVQRMQLAPYSAYIMKGWIKAVGVTVDPQDSTKVGATIAVNNSWKCAAKKGTTGDFDWKPFEIDFATGTSGAAEIACRLGYETETTGKAYFDNVTLEPNPDVVRCESNHFIIYLYKDNAAKATQAGIDQVMAELDRLYEGYLDLTGAAPYGGKKISAWAPKGWDIEAGGWSSDPVLYGGDPYERWSEPGDDPAVYMHEFGHNFDNGVWSFHGELFAEFMRFYCRDELKQFNAEEPKDWKPSERWKSGYDKEWGEDEWASAGGYVYKLAQIKDAIGWEPFKKTFRYFRGLPAAQAPKTAWDKIKIWNDKLSEYSGQDVWKLYTDKERKMIEVAFNTIEVEPTQTPAEVAAETKSIGLGAVKWDEAKVGWMQPGRNRIPDGGPLRSEANTYDSGLFAHAPSRYVFTLGGKWKRLTGTCGFQKKQRGSVVFVIKADGDEVYRSDLVTDMKERAYDIDLTRVRQLEMVVEDGGNGASADWGIWFGPTLTR